MSVPANTPHVEPVRIRGRWMAYLQLMRLPNAFTAMADVAMGFLFTHPEIRARDGWALGLLIAATSCLYTAGMALNDVFDVEIDSRERPDRPLPSGRISTAAARRLGWGLLGAGVLFGATVSALIGALRPAEVAVLLAGGVVLYDARLKSTVLGPLGMGACRALNVLLGMSAATAAWQAAHGLAAGAIGVYIAGVTWFARTEAHRSRRPGLLTASVLILAGIALLGFLPPYTPWVAPLLRQEPHRWPLLLTALGALIAVRLLGAVADPRPIHVQLAVRHAIHSLIVLDAALAFLVHGLAGAIPILLLLAPTLVLRRWVYST